MKTIKLCGCTLVLAGVMAATYAVEPTATEVKKVIAVLHPTSGNETKGVIMFTPEGDGIRISGTISGLKPNGKHGFHVHEWGDCSAPDGTSAGGHFNPTGEPHAAHDADKRHVGDLGNVTADNSGVAEVDILDKKMSFEGRTSIIGRGLIVHAKEDDLKSQPTGDAGDRIACGVIGVAKPQ